jgi:hypothetical protein
MKILNQDSVERILHLRKFWRRDLEVSHTFAPDDNSKRDFSVGGDKIKFKRYKISSRRPANFENLIQTNHERVLRLRNSRKA